MKNIISKQINFIKKHDNIFAIILFFLSIFGITINVFITNSDELWNFQNIYKMYNGFQIYKDANVIVTPLFFWIGEFLFKILGANFFIFRVYNIMIMLSLYFVTYLLLKKIGINKKISISIVLILITFKKYYLLLGQANYNTMALLLCLIGTYIYIDKYKYNALIQGIILFLIFMTKQNIGIFYGIGLVICELLNNKNLKEKKNNLTIEILIFLVLLIVFCIYLYINNNLYNFINYTALGIREFSNENRSLEITNLILAIFLVCANISLIVIFIRNEKINITKSEKEQMIQLSCFSIPLSLIMFPILNGMHFFIGIYLSIILFIYLMKIMIDRINIKVSDKIVNIILVIFCFLTCTYSINSFISWAKMIKSEEYNFDIKNPFYGGIFKEDTINNIENVVEHIENTDNNVIVLSSKAAFYMIPTGRSNGMMDLPFKGNLGQGGENGLIEKIKNTKNAEFLIEKDEENIEWQESKSVRKYIIDNMEKIGEIEEFEIYSNF